LLPVDNIPQASANSNVAVIASGKAKSSINAKKKYDKNRLALLKIVQLILTLS
jgi:hypothetical protein